MMYVLGDFRAGWSGIVGDRGPRRFVFINVDKKMTLKVFFLSFFDNFCKIDDFWERSGATLSEAFLMGYFDDPFYAHGGVVVPPPSASSLLL